MELVTILLSLLLSTSNLENTNTADNANNTDATSTEFVISEDIHP